MSDQIKEQCLSEHFGKTVELKQGDTKTMVRGDLTVLLWNDKRDVNVLSKMRHLPAVGDLPVETL
jgi:hypothetical protein